MGASSARSTICCSQCTWAVNRFVHRRTSSRFYRDKAAGAQASYPDQWAIRAQMRDITRIFGGECVPILVTRSNEWIQNENEAELSRNIPRAGGKIGITRT